MNYEETIEQTEKYLAFIPEHLQGDNENDLVSLLRRNFTLLKHYREGMERLASDDPWEFVDPEMNEYTVVRMTDYARKILEESK